MCAKKKKGLVPALAKCPCYIVLSLPVGLHFQFLLQRVMVSPRWEPGHVMNTRWGQADAALPRAVRASVKLAQACEIQSVTAVH